MLYVGINTTHVWRPRRSGIDCFIFRSTAQAATLPNYRTNHQARHDINYSLTLIVSCSGCHLSSISTPASPSLNDRDVTPWTLTIQSSLILLCWYNTYATDTFTMTMHTSVGQALASEYGQSTVSCANCFLHNLVDNHCVMQDAIIGLQLFDSILSFQPYTNNDNFVYI